MKERPKIHWRAGVLLALVVATGCSRADRSAPMAACPPEGTAAAVVDPILLAWLSKARTLHHLADLAEGEGSLDKAIASLEQLVGGVLPPGQPPEATEVMTDTFARLADLRARSGEYDRADRDIAAGLKLAPGPTYFRGHLLEVRGLVYEKQSAELEKAGRAAEAKQARAKALSASLEAVRIQDEVIKSALGDGGPATRE